MEVASTFANHFWGKDDVGYTRLVQKMHHSKQTCEEILSFYKERQAIEADYAKRLSNLAKRGLGSNETGTLRQSLDVIRATTETMARSHETTARQMTEQLSTPLEAFAASIRERRKTAEDTMVKLTKAKQSQNAAVEKSRNRYENECHKVSGFQAQQNLLVGKELEKNNYKLDRSQLAVESLQREYQDSLKVLSEIIEGWNREWKNTCDRFQDLEEERVNFLKSNLWAFANAVSTVCVTDDEGCENVRIALEKTEASRDIETFIELRGTGSQIIDPPEFTNYMSGFSRDNLKGTYKIANFSRDQPLGTTSYSGTKSVMSEDGDSSFDDFKTSVSQRLLANSSKPLQEARVSLVAPEPEDDYRSSRSASPYHETASPTSSLYSSNTTISASSPYEKYANQFSDPVAEAFEKPSKTVEKRRSWAVPFKRQSTPDLSRVWKAVHDDADRESIASSLRSSQDELRNSNSSQRSNRRYPTQPGQDPLLAALERLKSPTIEHSDSRMERAEPRAVTTNKVRPLSMPGVDALRGGRGAQNVGRVSMEAPADSARTRSPNRRQVGSGAPQDDFHLQHQQAGPQMYSAMNFSNPNLDHRGQAREQVREQRPQTRPRSKSSVDVRSELQSRYNDLPTRTSDGRPVVRYGRAQYDYRAAIPEEVSFRKGDVLLVVSMQEDGWWDAEVLGKRRFGLAPSNFLSNI